MRVNKPWGYYDEYDYVQCINGTEQKYKRIQVDPGASLSLQSHKLREEMWIIAYGQARVQIDNAFYKLCAFDTIGIPCGVKHRVTNIGTSTLSIIEVQWGTKCIEEDIVRYEDDYGRIS